MKAGPSAAAAPDEGEETPAVDNGCGSIKLEGWQALDRVLLVDQSPLGRTPRSNPAVYIGAFDDLRQLFADSPVAKQRGLGASAFSFNSAQGQCQRCRGAGFEKVEMQFLSDVFIRCPECDGRRYRPHILEVAIAVADSDGAAQGHSTKRPLKSRNWSIAELLEATAAEAVSALSIYADTKAGRRALAALNLLREVGLGYLRLGQPINTLSGGESQRLKLVGELAQLRSAGNTRVGISSAGAGMNRPTLFVFDEPTTGLHFEDVRVLLGVFQRLVDKGHSVLVVEHNLEVIKCADWVIDLGPEAGEAGGRVVAEGPPEKIAAHRGSHTGLALRDLLKVALRPHRRVMVTA